VQESLEQLEQKKKQKVVEVEVDGVTVHMNGAFEVLSIYLNPELDIPAQEKALKNALNSAREKIQKDLAKTMAGNLF
jgi:DNA-binding protein YbaB